MKIRKGLWAFALFAAFVYGTSAVQLAVPQCYQEKDQWCWDASAQAVLQFYRLSVTQTAIALYGTDGENIPNYLYGSSTFPLRRGVDLILKYFIGLQTTAYARYLTSGELLVAVTASRPPVIRWGWDSGGGHILVVRGMDGNMVTLMDPWDGPTLNTYDWVVRGSEHTWTHTLALNTPPPPLPEKNSVLELFPFGIKKRAVIR